MWHNFPFFPEQASKLAQRVDSLYFFLVALSACFVLLVFTLVIYFSIRYRRRSPSERPAPISGDLRLEALWIVIPLILAMVTFVWGARLYFVNSHPPRDAHEIFVVGKQWMWKIQHPNGRRMINRLHVPVGEPVKLIMTSEDVIHDFFIPAFRTKMDVLPGRYTTLWFEATRPGEYHLFCAEYCGTKHSEMIGKVIAMPPEAYERWLAGGTQGETLVEAGARLFEARLCNTCHTQATNARGPDLTGLFGKRVLLEDGSSVVADETYLRESILDPTARVVRGYPKIMPTFAGQLGEDDIVKLIAYIKSLTHPAQAPSTESTPTKAP